MIAAALLTFYDPVRLAEDMAVLDHVSRGRVSYVFGLGYRPEEFAMFGVPMSDRARRVEEHLEVLTTALRGEPFEHAGRSIWVTPRPYSENGPTMSYGGGSVPAARRAARFGLDFLAQTNGDDLADAYRSECRRVEHNPNHAVASISRGTTVDELRAEAGAHRIMAVDEAVEYVREKGVLPLHPLCGGLPPDVAWPYLERVVDEVLPAAAGRR